MNTASTNGASMYRNMMDHWWSVQAVHSAQGPSTTPSAILRDAVNAPEVQCYSDMVVLKTWRLHMVCASTAAQFFHLFCFEQRFKTLLKTCLKTPLKTHLKTTLKTPIYNNYI